MGPSRPRLSTPARALCAAAALCGLLSATSGCPRPAVEERPAVELALQVVARQSCGRISALDYDTSCAHAAYVRVLSPSRTTLYERCIELDSAPADLGELLQGQPLFRFAGLSTARSVIFELRVFHGTGLTDVEQGGLCANPAQKSHWLLWGESQVVDLASYDHDDAGSALIPIVVDCRDCAIPCGNTECFGCLAMAQDAGPGCPADFPPSVCAPASAAQCAIPCQRDQDCFEGAQRCVNNTCDATDTGGTLCSRCSAGTPCQTGLSCVARTAQAQEGVCVLPCPDNTCVTGTKCTRIGNGAFTVELAGD